MRSTSGVPSSAAKTLLTALEIGILCFLLGIALLYAYDTVESEEPVRRGVGEVRWFQLATQPALAYQLKGYVDSTVSSVLVTGISEPIQQAWVLNMVRYGCPSSDVQMARGIEAARNARGAATTATIEVSVTPACTPSFAEFLEPAALSGWQPVRWLLALVGLAGLGMVLRKFVHSLSAGRQQARISVELEEGDRRMRRTSMFSEQGLRRWTCDFAAGWAMFGILGALSTAIGGSPRLGFGVALGLAVVMLGSVWVRRERSIEVSSLVYSKHQRGPQESGSWSATTVVALLVFAGLALVAQIRTWLQPLWSWDHLAMWGFKTRQLATGERFFLDLEGYLGVAPDYPLGVPASWLLLSLGAVPNAWDFHFAVSLTAALCLISAWYLLEPLPLEWRTLALGFIASSPIFYDLESVGLAELPLLAWALLSLLASNVATGGLRQKADAVWSDVLAILLLTMVCLTKDEGLPLALGLGAVILISRDRGNGLKAPIFAGVAVLGFGISTAATSLQTQANTSFFRGEVVQRLKLRLGTPEPILSELVGQTRVETLLPYSIAVAVALVLAGLVGFQMPGQTAQGLLRTPSPTRRAGVGLAGVVLLLLASYVGVYFGTPEDPRMHIATSWHRILGPLFVLAIVSLGWVLGNPEVPRRRG